MKAVEIILGVLLILFALVIIAVILLQEGRRSGVAGAVSGGADTFLSKNTLSAKLQKITKYITVVFMLLVIAADVISILGK